MVVVVFMSATSVLFVVGCCRAFVLESSSLSVIIPGSRLLEQHYTLSDGKRNNKNSNHQPTITTVPRVLRNQIKSYTAAAAAVEINAIGLPLGVDVNIACWVYPVYTYS